MFSFTLLVHVWPTPIFNPGYCYATGRSSPVFIRRRRLTDTWRLLKFLQYVNLMSLTSNQPSEPLPDNVWSHLPSFA